MIRTDLHMTLLHAAANDPFCINLAAWAMSKRLNKRQQRELEELEALKAAQHDVSGVQDEDDGEGEVEEEDQSGPSNPFAAVSRVSICSAGLD